jgi:hypothetical protein
MLTFLLLLRETLIFVNPKPTSKVTVEENSGAPFSFLSLIEYKGPCEPSGGYCHDYLFITKE